MVSNSTFAETLVGSSPTTGVELLLSLLAEAASGRDISTALPSILEVVFGRSNAHPVIKKLTYDLCKFSTNLSDQDCDFLAGALKNDVGSANPDLALSALRFLPCMPSHHLGHMQETGDLHPLLLPPLQHKEGNIRAAAVSCLHHVLTCPAVLDAAAVSVGPASSLQDRWVRLSDMLLDEEPMVVGAAAAAVAELLEAAQSTPGLAATPAGLLVQRAANATAARVAAALGPVLETCAFAPAPDQVSVAKILLLLVQHHLRGADASTPAAAAATVAPVTSAADEGPPAVALGSLVPAACSYLHDRVGALDVSVRLECCRSLLGILALIKDATASGDLLLGSALVPELWAMSAVSSLLELHARLLVEPALPDVVLTIARSLATLPASVRQNAVQQLLPLVSQVVEVPCRMEAYALVWDQVLKEEMQRKLSGEGAAGKGAGLSLASLLTDAYLGSLVKGTLGGGAFGQRSMDRALRQVGAAGIDASASSTTSSVAQGLPRAVAEGREEDGDEVWWEVPHVQKGGRRTGPGPVAEGKEDESKVSGFFKGMTGAFKGGGKKENKPADGGEGSGIGQQAKAAATSAADKTAAAGKAVAGSAAAAGKVVADGARAAVDRTAGAGRAAADGTAAASKAAADKTAAAGKVVAEQASTAAAGARTAAGNATAATAAAAERTAAAAGGGGGGGVFGFGLTNFDAPWNKKDERDPASVAAAAAAAEQQQRMGQPPVQAGDPGLGHTAKAAAAAVGAAVVDGAAAAGVPNQILSLVSGVPTEVPKRVLGLNTHRHELVVTLLDAAHRQAQVCGVLETCLAAQSAAVHDRAPTTAAAASAAGDDGARDARVAYWVHIARTVLIATQACVGWEPMVTPAITTQLSSDADGHAAADFSSLPADCWLQLLQAACHAARAAPPLLRSRPPPSGTILADALEQEGRELQVLLRQLLRCWGALSRPVRVRVVWVAVHYCALPDALDEGWELVLKALGETMSRTGQALRLNEVMASASLGTLFRSERQSWPRDKPFVFDVVAASALCERPDLELTSLVVGLACLQHLATLLLNALGAATAAAVAAVAAGKGEEEAGEGGDGPRGLKQVQADVVLVAARVEALARDVQSGEVAASPHLREWIGRIMRMCGAAACYVPPEGATRPPAADNGSSSDDEPAPPASTSGPAPVAPPTFPGMARAESSSSSDHDSIPSYQLPVMMPPAMYGRPPSRINAPPRGPQGPNGSPGGQFSQPALDKTSTSLTRMGSIRQSPRGAGSVAGPPGMAGGAGMPTTVSTVVPPPPYLSYSYTGDCLWGYPFSGPRTSVLFHSKRSKRQRILMEHLQAARQKVLALQRQRLQQRGPPGAGDDAAAGATGKLLAAAGYRLDSPELWQALPGSKPHHWQELSGPADPLLLRGCVIVPGRGALAASAAGLDGGFGAEDAGLLTEDSVWVVLEVTSRLKVDVVGAEVAVRTSGPVLVERRGMVWELPRMGAGDKAQRCFQMRLLGHAPVEVLCGVQLYPTVLPGQATPLQLYCLPLHVSMVAVLRPLSPPPPAGAAPSAAEFFRQWSNLPARTSVSGLCAWPGIEGQVLALSGMLRQPLVAVSLQFLAASSAHQAAFVSATLTGHQVCILVFTQLVPPALPSASPHASQSVCQVCVRSSSPEFVRAVQLHSSAWLQDLSGGAVLPGGVSPPAMHTVGRTKPPIDPRVSAMQHGFLAASSASAAAAGVDGVTQPAAAGPKVGHSWLRSTALAEWQRLVSLIDA